MKFYQVMTDECRKVFKTKSEAVTYLKDLKVNKPEEFESAAFDCMDVTINAETVFMLLTEEGGYCDTITDLPLP